jgi:hypothetical protein
MKREYSIGTADSVTYFTGVEIEQTPAYGMQTLFVVGIQSIDKIVNLAHEHDCTHIYFGANQSFPKIDCDDARIWKQWEVMIKGCLDTNFWCTLDLDVACVEGLLEGPLVEYRRFIPQLSIKIPYLTQLGYNATIKLDDKDFDATNPGVWCHRLRDLTTTESFTSWDAYGKDEIVK